MAHNSRQCSHTKVHCHLKVPILALLSPYPVVAVYLGSMPTCVFGGCLLASLFHLLNSGTSEHQGMGSRLWYGRVVCRTGFNSLYGLSSISFRLPFVFFVLLARFSFDMVCYVGLRFVYCI